MTTREEIQKYLSHRLWGNVVDVYPAKASTPVACRFCKKSIAELVAVVSLKLSNVYESVCSDFAACEARTKKRKEDERLAYAETQKYLESLELPVKD